MKERSLVTLTNLIIAGVIVWQILELNPNTRTYIRHYMQYARYYTWYAATPAWLREAMQVRGLL